MVSEDDGHKVMMLDLVDLYGVGAPVDVVVAERDGVLLLAPRFDVYKEWRATHLTCDDDQWVGDVKSATAGDLDGDGIAELVLSCENAVDGRSGMFYLRRNPGEAWDSKTACSPPVDVAGRAGTKFDLVRLADIDMDGYLDVVTSEEEAGLGVVWYRNPLGR